MAKPVVVDVQHSLGQAEARRRVEKGFGSVRDQIAPKGLAVEERWENDQLLFKTGAFGQNIAGRIQVLENIIRIEVDLPWLLASMAQPLTAKLQGVGQLLLEKK
ncbi:Putative polyhydroxyalkanoic acid system protein (PHA_gran_rgn) [Faunimonas pinastri]|uniref:Putative polyhydroxyalkanoic acid system protein (PHA_gran_rgn) n=1 Tax=Faunimonas pinastri TaxID=1855383 RepID=A0A1H9JEB4_9HYPH|nr:polyhydroxyalkanoic acid system family protein [Faunimonas pinastri]SEQ85079.1 Putative polyhydroxyalkanoic acid system protein (PHA_gran_rgn) [Faunimonas pinastri]